MSGLAYWLGMMGIHTIRGALQVGVVGVGFATIFIMKTMDEVKAKNLEKMKKENEVLRVEKEYMANQTYDAEKEKKKIEIKQEHEAIEIKKKEKENLTKRMIDKPLEKLSYRGMPQPIHNGKVNPHALLLGYVSKDQIIWDDYFNLIITGRTGSGKSRMIMTMLINFLRNHEGIVYIVDLKKTDYRHFIGIPEVKCYIDDVNRVKEALEMFREECDKREKLINEGYIDENGVKRLYVDMEDYNMRNPQNVQKDFILLIDEFADISDTFTNAKGRPYGIYADIIQFVRTARARGGKVILGTQRPSADVIVGTMKNNTKLYGLACLNELNSRIVIDASGCEDLEPQEVLGYVDGKLVKFHTFTLDNDQIIKETDKLKRG